MLLPVTDDGIRPAGNSTHCFYCQSPKGEHTADCVCRTKTVVIKATIECVVEVPASWDPHDVEFKYNESSHCASNLLRGLGEWAEKDQNCACGSTNVEFRIGRKNSRLAGVCEWK